MSYLLLLLLVPFGLWCLRLWLEGGAAPDTLRSAEAAPTYPVSEDDRPTVKIPVHVSGYICDEYPDPDSIPTMPAIPLGLTESGVRPCSE